MARKSAFEKFRETEREIRREYIIDSAMALFEIIPFHKIGMRDIAEEAGVSAASIYRYFSGRDDLFAEALLLNVADIRQRVKNRTRKNRLSFEELGELAVNYFLEHETTFQLLCHFMIKKDISSNAKRKFNLAQCKFLNAYETLIERNRSTEDIRELLESFFAALIGVVLTFRNYPGKNQTEIKALMHHHARIIASAFNN